MDRVTKAKNSRTEMTMEVTSLPPEATIWSEFSTGFASTGKASPETAVVFQIWALFRGILRGGVLKWMALLEERVEEAMGRDELWVLREKRDFRVRMG